MEDEGNYCYDGAVFSIIVFVLWILMSVLWYFVPSSYIFCIIMIVKGLLLNVLDCYNS